MNWYKTVISEQKLAIDWSSALKGFLQGTALALPVMILTVSYSLNISPAEAESIVKNEPQRAQQIVQSAPPEIIERAKQEGSTPIENVQQESITLQPPIQKPLEETNKASLVSPEEMAPFIAQWEGRQPYSYVDGNSKSVGYGFYLGNATSRKDIEAIGANFDEVFAGRQPLNDQQMDQLLKLTSQRAVHDARSAVPDLSSHPREVQVILVDMAHTLGNKISHFPKMLKALQERDYSKVADEMQDSRWFGQTGRRGRHHVEQMRSIANSQSAASQSYEN